MCPPTTRKILHGAFVIPRQATPPPSLLWNKIPRGGGHAEMDLDLDQHYDQHDNDEQQQHDEEDFQSMDEDDQEDLDYSSDEEDSYDQDQYDDEEDDAQLLQEDDYDIQDTSVKQRSDADDNSFDQPMPPSSIRSFAVTIAVMMYSRKLDPNDPKVVRAARLAFIGYILLVQLFVSYVRLKARLNNNQTTIQVQNPMAKLVQTQLHNAVSSKGGSTSTSTSKSTSTNAQDTTMQSLTQTFLSSKSTIMDYDMAQANQMRNGLLFPMITMWVLHFKFGQVQPVFLEVARGILGLVESCLFQVYVLGRALERPFRVGGVAGGDEADKEEEDGLSRDFEAEGTEDEDEDEDEDYYDNEDDYDDYDASSVEEEDGDSEEGTSDDDDEQ